LYILYIFCITVYVSKDPRKDVSWFPQKYQAAKLVFLFFFSINDI